MKEIFDGIVYINKNDKRMSYTCWSAYINNAVEKGELIPVDFSIPKELTLEIVEIATSYSKTPQLLAKDIETGYIYVFMAENMMKLISLASNSFATVTIKAKRKGTANNCYYYQMVVL